METLLTQLGINTEQLYAKPIHDREETQTIMGCTHRTLRNWEDKGYIIRSKFKNRNYYITNEIVNCARKQIGLDGWENIWDDKS